jgi:hypothetical protein
VRDAAIGLVMGITLLSACESTGPKAPSVTGTWAGAVQTAFTGNSYGLTFSLRQTQSTVTGTWVASQAAVVGIQYQGSLTGSAFGDSVNVSLGQNGFVDNGVFVGRMNPAGDTITGQLSGLQVLLIRR